MIIHIHAAGAAKRRAVSAAAYSAGRINGLTPIQSDAVARHALDSHMLGASPARAIGSAWQQARRVARGAA